MKLTVVREALLKPLNVVAGVVERRQTLPILSNVLLKCEGNALSLTGTDLEVELIGRIELEGGGDNGEVTLPARKLLDICKSLPEGSSIEITTDQQRAVLRSGRSRFTLATLPASEFPSVEEGPASLQFDLSQGQLRQLIEHTGFAMAQQDVRYYLNGMLWELKDGDFRVVATDGHRLALSALHGQNLGEGSRQVIVPRKGVLELGRLLSQDEAPVHLSLGNAHLRVTTPEFTFTSKLVDGKFPDYERVLPRNSNKTLVASREELRQAFSRASILSNEKYRGVRLHMADNELKIIANNPEQEEAEEVVPVEYDADTLEIGFNVSYLLDVLGVLRGERVKLSLSDANSSALLEDEASADSVYVVMPMRL